MLKHLLRQKHWQTYRTFCMQYDKAARTIDESLAGTYPSRAQLHRWQSGDLKGLPYPHHCQVLEAMFPGVTADHMFSPVEDDGEPSVETEPRTGPALLRSIADGLASPDSPRPNWHKNNSSSRADPRAGPQTTLPHAAEQYSVKTGPEADITEHIASSVMALGEHMHLHNSEITKIATLAGNLVDLTMECSIDIDTDGWATVTYCHRVLNLTHRPVKRMTREQWFETTSGLLKIEPHPDSDRKVHIQRIHDTPNMSKFACQFSPGIEPGEVATISYTSQGGRFIHDHYWRQSIPRYTRYFALNIRHRGASMLLNYTAIEEQLDGSESSAIEDLVCSDEDGDALITLTRDYLQPGQALTVRWEASHAASRSS